MADTTTGTEREGALSAIRELTGQIEATRAELDRLYERRGDLFLETSELDSSIPVKAMADAAGGITGPAVSQQIEKARARREARTAAAS